MFLLRGRRSLVAVFRHFYVNVYTAIARLLEAILNHGDCVEND